MTPRPTPHDLKLLGVTSTATLADLNRAFRARARTLHPDRGGDPHAFQELNNAHQRLKEALARPSSSTTTTPCATRCATTESRYKLV